MSLLTSWQHLLREVGWPFVSVVISVYWLQGFRQFAWFGVTFLLKDELLVSPAQLSMLWSTAYLPWSIKPVYGILSDCLPIAGSRRVSYIALSCLLTGAAWAVLTLPPVTASAARLLPLLVLTNIGAAMSDVVVDAMVAQQTRSEAIQFAGDLQALSWMSMSMGGLVGSALSGVVLNAFGPRTSFLVMALLNFATLIPCAALPWDFGSAASQQAAARQADDQRSGELMEEGTQRKGRRSVNGEMQGAGGRVNGAAASSSHHAEKSNVVVIEKSPGLEPPRSSLPNAAAKDTDWHKGDTAGGPRRRQPGEDGAWQGADSGGSASGREAAGTSVSRPSSSSGQHHEVPATLVGAFVLHGRLVWGALRNKMILRPLLWFFLAQAVVPIMREAQVFFLVNHLGLSMQFISLKQTTAFVGLLLGTVIYNRYLKGCGMRRIFFWSHVAMAATTLPDLMLATRLNLALGIPDQAFAVGSSSLHEMVTMFKFMPFLVLSAKLCPPGIEGTLFAVFMSVHNFGATCSGYLSAWLALALGIDENNFENLPIAIVVQMVMPLVPLALLWWVPRESDLEEDKEE